MATCSQCDRPLFARGLCRRCYWRAFRAGNLEEHPRRCDLRPARDKYGLTAEGYEELLRAQGNACAICRRAFSKNRLRKTMLCANVDHDHLFGHVRGLLCGYCNSGLGFFADDPERLRAAADYLERTIWGYAPK